MIKKKNCFLFSSLSVKKNLLISARSDHRLILKSICTQNNPAHWKKNEAKFVVAGTSAGAAAMSNTMIISGSSEEALIKDTLELTNGLDLINSVFIDTHFTQRGRIGRLIQTVTSNPGILGIGLGEDTSAVIHKEEMEVCGSGLVVVIDGKCIQYTDLTEIKDGEPITVEGIRMHVLGPGKKFLIGERKLRKEQRSAGD